MKSIRTLVQDIYNRVSSSEPFNPESVAIFCQKLTERISNKLSEERQRPTLRLSNFGMPCDRKLWYTINQPERGEALPPAARIKFLFGDILEELLLFLARESGHTVENEQKEVEINGVPGHIDGTIDGELVDCKSASSASYHKFDTHGLAQEDSFGYLPQLGSYGSRIGTGNDHFLAIDKQLGKITLDTWPKSEVDYGKQIDEKRELLARKDPPPRGFSDEAFGSSGNRKLGVACSYCPFKRTCWGHLRTFAYARGPVDLTVVRREPDVPEIKR